MSRPIDMGMEAVRLAEDLGVSVIPIHKPDATQKHGCSCRKDCGNVGKHPLLKGWQADVTDDPDEILEIWGAYPGANIGVPTGAVNQLVAADLDRHNEDDDGIEAWAKFWADHGGLKTPETMKVSSGGNGEHPLFWLPPGVTMKGSAGPSTTGGPPRSEPPR